MLLRRVLADGQRARLGLGSKFIQKPGLIVQLRHGSPPKQPFIHESLR